MAWRRTKTGLCGRFILWLVIVCAGGVVIFNMVFVLPITSELSLLPHKIEDPREKLTRSTTLDDRKRQYIAGKPSGARYLELEIYSSKENVTLTLNGKTRVDQSEMLIRGLNVVVLNEVTGDVMSSRWYDTYESKADSGFLVNHLKGLRRGRIICVAIKDDAVMQLSKEARDYIATIGSSFINRLQFRSTWAFVVQRINDKLFVHAESFQNPLSGDEWARAVKLRTWVKLLPETNEKCNWADTVANRRRQEFCDVYEGYGDVCKCEEPVTIELNPPPFTDGSRLQLPIAVMASNRPYYLLRMLRGLQKVEGLDPSTMTVFIDGFWDEPAAVTTLMGLKLQQHAGVSQRNARVAQHYKRSIHDSFEQHPNANYLVILEEDLDVSIDILSYFKQLLPVYEKDASVYCISAWNDQGYEHLCNDPAMMYRVETMPGLGWVLSRKLFKNELEEKWPKPHEIVDWDMWTRMPSNRKERECIIPDISRTYHFGGKGINVGGLMQALYFEKHAINQEAHVKMDPDKMYKENYEKEIHHLLSEAKVLNHTKTPCANKDDFIPDTHGKLYVFYISMEFPGDFKTWESVASCLRMWDLDARGFHKSMWRFWLKKNHVLVIGCPASVYCSYKPAEIEPLYIPRIPAVPR